LNSISQGGSHVQSAPIRPSNAPSEARSRRSKEHRPPTSKAPNRGNADVNLKEQGRHGNIKQNTTHQGYQQDR